MTGGDRPSALRFGTFVPLALTLWLTAGCADEPGAERVPFDGGPQTEATADALPRELQVQLDSGNAAYRARDYEAALAHFENVTASAPELAVGWYGVGMTQAALGNQAAADSAMMRVHGLAPDIPLEHPGAGAPPNPHPATPPDPDRYEGGKS